MQQLKSFRDEYEKKWGFKVKQKLVHESEPGLSEKVVKEMSDLKGETQEHGWIQNFRLKALQHFMKRPMPKWGGDLSNINFDDIVYYRKPTDKDSQNWEDVPPEIKKTFEKLGIPEAERKFLSGVGAQFECLSSDTKVFTNPKGPVEIMKIKPEDSVFSYNEERGEINVCKVKDVMFKGVRPVFEVTVGTRKIKATFNHPFLALSYRKEKNKERGKFKLEWKYLKNLKEGDLVAVTKDFPDVGKSMNLPQVEIPNDNWRYNKVILPKTTNEELMWLLGLHLGDGFIHREKSKARVDIAIPDSDSQLRKEVSKVSKKLFNINISENDKDRVTIYSTIIADFIEKMGFGGKSKTKKIPKWIYSLPKNQILSFLGGYIDSDGYVRNNIKNHDIVITSVNKSNLEEIKNLSIFSGLTSSKVHKITGKYNYKGKTQFKTFYRIQISGNIDKIKCRSEKRYLRFGKRKNYHKFTHAGNTTFTKHTSKYVGFAKIKSIKFVGKEPVFDIEVDGPHNFVAEGIVVHNSENVYHKIREDLEKKGVIFVDPNTGLMKYPHIFKKYFSTIVPPMDNKFAALNSAFFSGGSFIYIPPHVEVKMPLQAYFRINSEGFGQFERTLIIVDKGAKAHYIEGCTAPVYSKDSLHAAVVEIVALPGSHFRYTTLQNWSNNVYNLVTKRSHAYEGATVEWVDANIGCLAEGTVIFTNPDFKPIEEISQGDKVLTFNEETKNLEVKEVLATKFSGIKTVYEVILEDGKRVIDATANHPFLTINYYPNRASKLGRYQFCWKKLEELKVHDFVIVSNEFPDIGHPYLFTKLSEKREILGRNQYGAEYIIDTTYKYNDLEVPRETTKDLMWLLGLLVGDGNVAIAKHKKTGSNRYGRIIFSIPRKDNARSKLLELMKKVFKLDKFKERKDSVTITYNSLILAEFLENIGFKGNAKTKQIPKWVFSLPHSQKLSFLAGYIEADGSIKGNNARLKTCNKKLLEDLKTLCMMCGIEVNKIQDFVEFKKIEINKNAQKKEYKNYVMHISKLYKLRNYLSEKNKDKTPIRKEKHIKEWRLTKTRRIKLPKHLAIYKITQINKKSELPTFDIEVDGSHNFVANGVIVHNSKLTMKYPSVFMFGQNSRADILSVAFAGEGQHQDTGGKAMHFAPNTTSRITAKSVSKDGGRTSYRGQLFIHKDAENVKSSIRCDAILLDEISKTDTYPYNEVNNDSATITHEASVGKIGEEQLFYLMSKGLSEQEALNMVVMGFFDAFTKEIPLEYAIEFNRLIQLEMSGAVG